MDQTFYIYYLEDDEGDIIDDLFYETRELADRVRSKKGDDVRGLIEIKRAVVFKDMERKHSFG